MRIYELAKSINLSNKEIIVKLAGLGISVKSHMSNIDDETAEKLIGIFTKEGKVKEGTKLSPPKKKEKPAKPAAPKKAKEATEVQPSPPKAAADTKTAPAPKEAVTQKETAPEKEAVAASEAKEVLDNKPKKDEDPGNKTKFKAKPGMQRAFDSIRRVEVSKKGYDFKPRFKKHDKKSQVRKSEAPDAPTATQPRKRELKFQEGTTVKEFSELIGQKLNDVIKKFMELGSMPTINQPFDPDAANIIAEAFGLKLEITKIEDDDQQNRKRS